VMRKKKAQRSQRAPNQSSSWPFVEDDLKEAGPDDEAPKPMLSNAGTGRF